MTSQPSEPMTREQAIAKLKSFSFGHLQQAGEMAIAALRREGELVEAFDLVLRLEPDWTDSNDAPGHSHKIPGVWDKNNGPPNGGYPCEWCQAWIGLMAAFKTAKQLDQPAGT